MRELLAWCWIGEPRALRAKNCSFDIELRDRDLLAFGFF